MTLSPVPRRRARTALATLAAVPLVLGLSVAAAPAATAAEPLPEPLIRYTFDSEPGAATIANEGSLGAAFDALVRSGTSLPRGTGPTADAGASARFPGGAQNSPSQNAPYLEIPVGLFEDVEAMTVSTWIKWDGRNANQRPWTYIIGSDGLPRDNWGLFYVPNEDNSPRRSATPVPK